MSFICSLSNFYFFAGVQVSKNIAYITSTNKMHPNWQVGHTFVRRLVVESWPVGCPTVLFFLYCCSQVMEARGQRTLFSCKELCKALE